MGLHLSNACDAQTSLKNNFYEMDIGLNPSSFIRVEGQHDGGQTTSDPH